MSLDITLVKAGKWWWKFTDTGRFLLQWGLQRDLHCTNVWFSLYMCLRFTLQETLVKDTLSYCSSSTCFIIIHLSFLRRKFEFVFEILSRSTLFCHVFPCKWYRWYRLSEDVRWTYYNLFPPCFICKLSLLHGSISKFKTQSFKFLQTTTDFCNMF